MTSRLGCILGALNGTINAEKGTLMKYLALITKIEDGYDGFIPELCVHGDGKTQEEVIRLLSEGLALHLEDLDPIEPKVHCFQDVDEDIREAYGDRVVHEFHIEPAPMNPISLQIEKAILHRGVTYRKLAKRLNTSHSSLVRLTNPFYWGHNVRTLRKLAEALDLDLEIKFSIR